jgi:hypothetical protein
MKIIPSLTGARRTWKIFSRVKSIEERKRNA